MFSLAGSVVWNDRSEVGVLTSWIQLKLVEMSDSTGSWCSAGHHRHTRICCPQAVTGVVRTRVWVAASGAYGAGPARYDLAGGVVGIRKHGHAVLGFREERCTGTVGPQTSPAWFTM